MHNFCNDRILYSKKASCVCFGNRRFYRTHDKVRMLGRFLTKGHKKKVLLILPSALNFTI